MSDSEEKGQGGGDGDRRGDNVGLDDYVYDELARLAVLLDIRNELEAGLRHAGTMGLYLGVLAFLVSS